MEKQKSKAARLGALSGCIMFSVCVAGAGAQAQNWYWIGGSSSNWSDVGNWNSQADGQGNWLDSTGSLANKNIMLQAGGVFAPSNQDITPPPLGFAIGELRISRAALPLEIAGEEIQLSAINITDDSSADPTLTVRNNLVLGASGTWRVPGNVQLQLYGDISGVDENSRFRANSDGTTHFFGAMKASGGFDSNQGALRFYGIETAAAQPEVFNPDYFTVSSGRFYFHPPVGYPAGKYYEYEFNENYGACSAGTMRLEVLQDVAVTINGPVYEKTASKNFDKQSNGVLYLNGDYSLTGNISAAAGMLALNGALGEGNGTSLMTANLGGFDLNGNDVTNRNLTFTNGQGFNTSGGFRNSNMDDESVIYGDITGMGSGVVVHFGGSGDIRLAGDILPELGATALNKRGSGTLSLAGANAYTNAFEIAAGTLRLDYGAVNASKVGDTAILGLNGNLSMLGNAEADSDEVVRQLSVGNVRNSSANSVRISPEGRGDKKMTLRFSTMNMNTTCPVDFAPIADGAILCAYPTNEAPIGILAPRMTYNGSTFARVAASQSGGYYEIEGLPDNDYSTGFVSGNTEIADISGNTVVEGSTETAAAIRFNSQQSSTLTLNAALNIRGGQSGHRGGILVTKNVGANPTIIDGSGVICGNIGDGALHVMQYNDSAPLIIDATIATGSAATSFGKSGPGELILTSGLNSFRDLNVFEGTLTAHIISNANISSSIGRGTDVLLGAATLKYVGDGDSTDKNFKLRGDAALDASGSGPLVLTRATSFTTSDGNDHRLTLTGSGAGEVLGVMDLQVGRLRKTGSGVWTLGAPASGADIAVTNFFWGGTIVEEGKLVVNCALGRNVAVNENGALAGSGAILHNLDLDGALEVNPASGVLTIEHNAIIGDNATLSIAGGMVKGEYVEVLRANGKIIGEFADVPNRYRLRYNANSIEVQDRIMETLIIVK